MTSFEPYDPEFLRHVAYREEADPIFFKWQRGEATEQEWLDKVQEIRERYPSPEEPEAPEESEDDEAED